MLFLPTALFATPEEIACFFGLDDSSRYACGLMFDMFGGVGLGRGLMTLLWMCFGHDVTCLQLTIRSKKEHACNIDRLRLYVKSWISQRSAAGSGSALPQGDAPLREKQFA